MDEFVDCRRTYEVRCWPRESVTVFAWNGGRFKRLFIYFSQRASMIWWAEKRFRRDDTTLGDHGLDWIVGHSATIIGLLLLLHMITIRVTWPALCK